MRILYVIPSLLIGGAESLVVQWAAYLQQQGHQIEVCTLYTTGPFAQPLAAANVAIHDLAHDPGIARYKLRRKYDPRLLRRLRLVVQQGRYDIVHAHLFPALLFTGLVALTANEPAYVYSEHSVNNRRRRFLPLKLLDRFLYGRYGRIVAVSEAVAQSLRLWQPHLAPRLCVIPNAVDPDRFRVASDDVTALRQLLEIGETTLVVLYAGRLVPEKGPDVLLEALVQLQGRVETAVRVLVAGEGPMRAQLEAHADTLKDTVTVSFLGNRTDMPQLLALADVVVLPSRWEGLPMILLEAMAAQTPVVATGVGGIPGVITHGRSGWLAAAEDPSTLAEGLCQLLASAALRQRLSQNAYETLLARYSPEVAFSQLLNVYRSALKTST